MGSNRAGVKAKARAKRRKREEIRLSAKAALAETAQNHPGQSHPGVAAAVKSAVVAAAHKVGDVVSSAAHRVKDAITKNHPTETPPAAN